MLLAVAVAIAGYYGYTTYLAPMPSAQSGGGGNGGGGNGGGGSGRPPPTVTTAEATRERWTPTLQATGTLQAVRDVQVTPEIAGVVAEAPMRSATAVAEGDTLVRLRAAELEAGLQALRAQRTEARSAYQRAQRLYEQGNAPQARLDETRARFRSLTAQIEEQRARIEKKTVSAPFDGVLGLTDVDVGQYVSPGEGLVTLQDLTPMQASFTLPEQVLPQVSKGQRVRLRIDAYPDMTFEGEVTAIDPRVDEKTRNFEVEATLPNQKRRLRPGMFARVTLEIGDPRERVTLPQTAVVSNPYGNSVYVVQTADQGPPKVTQKMITTGAQRGTQVAITDGLQGGEQVVTSGQIKLREGAPVQVDNAKQPPDTANPDIQEP
jgi:membrane fusion protein (multidrug efflux system)